MAVCMLLMVGLIMLGCTDAMEDELYWYCEGVLGERFRAHEYQCEYKCFLAEHIIVVR